MRFNGKPYMTDKYGVATFWAGIATLIFFIAPVHAQVSAGFLPKPDYDNSISFGLSYGEQLKRDADFVGWTVEYSRAYKGPWYLNASLAWDTETAKDKQTDTYTLIGTVSYAFSPLMNITAGYGKGIANDDNKDKHMQFTNGDSSVGVALGTRIPVFPKSSRYSLGFSASYEYNISENETDISLDLGLGRGF